MSFTEELLKAVEEGFTISFRKGFFKQTLEMRIADFSEEPPKNIVREISTSDCDDEILQGNLRFSKLQLLRKTHG